MSSAEMNPVSAAERLDALAASFNTVVRKNHLKISDVCVRSIADPATAFEQRPHFFQRVAHWFVRSVLRRETAFTVSGVGLKVRMYDTPSNVREIRHLFRSALQEVTHLKTPPDKERMLHVLQFALNVDKLACEPPLTETSQKILKNYLMGLQGGEVAPEELEVRDLTVERSFGGTLVDCAWPLAKEGKLQLQNVAMLFSATQEVLTDKERASLVRIIGFVLRQHVKQAKTLGEVAKVWERDLQILKEADIIIPGNNLADGCSSLVNAVETCVEKNTADIPTLARLYVSSHGLLSEMDRERFVASFAVVFRRSLERATNFDQIRDAWKSGMTAISEAGITLPKEEAAACSKDVVERIQPLLEGGQTTQLIELYSVINEALLPQDKTRVTTAICGAFCHDLEGALTLDEMIDLWRSTRSEMQEAGITLGEEAKGAFSVTIRRLEELSHGVDDIPKLHLLFDIFYPSLSEAQQRQFAQTSATIACQTIGDVEGSEEILKAWTTAMRQLRGEKGYIPFIPKDFEPLVTRLENAWNARCLQSLAALKEGADFKTFHRVAGEEAIRLKEMFLGQEEEIHQLTRFCPPQLRDRLDGQLNATMGKALATFYQQIQQKVLSIVLPEIERLKDRESLTAAAVNLRALKTSLRAFSVGAIDDETILRHNEVCLKMIDEALEAIAIKLPPPAPSPQTTTTTHVLSHNVITINGVAQSAMMSAIGMYAAPALIQSFGVAGAVASIGLTVAAPLIITVGSALVAPVGSFIDRQCERLPVAIQKPLKYIWRVGLSAAVLYVGYRAYQGWSTRSVVPVLPQAQLEGAGVPVQQQAALSARVPSPQSLVGGSVASDICLPPAVASASVAGAWTPKIQRQYEAAVAAGTGPQFLDTLQRSLGYGSPSVAPPPLLPSGPKIQAAIPPVLVELSVPPSAPPPVAVAGPSKAGWFTRISNAFIRGRQQMDASSSQIHQGAAALGVGGAGTLQQTVPPMPAPHAVPRSEALGSLKEGQGVVEPIRHKVTKLQ